MAKPPKRGRNLEKLVAHLERATQHRDNVTIESPKFIPDIETGVLREHDVVLTYKMKHHEIVLAIECKDSKKKVGSPTVEGFYAKCQKTGVNQGIIVSSHGFSKPAIIKANNRKIDCLTLEQVDGFDWCLAPGLELTQRHITKTHFVIFPATPTTEKYELFQNDGTKIDSSKINQIGVNCLSKVPLTKDSTEQGSMTFIDKAPKFHIIDANGDRVEVQALKVIVDFEVRSKLIPMKFHEYIDKAKSTILYSIAHAEIDQPGLRGRFMIVQEEGKGGSIYFVPDKTD